MSQAVQLSDKDLTLSDSAAIKMSELIGQVEDNIEGVRVFATPGGCSGVSFGMTFTDQINDDDSLREFGDFKLIIDSATMQYLQGVEIDFVGDGGEARFVFNNMQPVSGGGCGTCGSSQGGGCS